MSTDPIARELGTGNLLLLRLAPLSVAMAIGFLTVSMPLPALPLHVSGMGFGTAVAGLAVGIQSLATATRPGSGRMVDTRGAKTALLCGLVTCSGAGWLYVASLAVPQASASLLVLVAGRLVLGVGESLLITGVLGWSLARAGPKRAGRAMTWNGMAQYGALALGAPAGFWLYKAYGFAPDAASTALLPLLALALVAPLEPVAPSGHVRMPLRSVIRCVWGPGVSLMLGGVGFAAISTFASLDFVARGWSGAGYTLFAYGACFVGVRTVASGLPDRLGGTRIAAASMALEAVGQTLLWSAPSPAAALVGAALTGAGCSLIFPSLGIEAFRRVPSEQRGITVGVFAAFQDLAIGSTGPILGTVAAESGTATVFLLGALAASAGAAAAARLRAP